MESKQQDAQGKKVISRAAVRVFESIEAGKVVQDERTDGRTEKRSDAQVNEQVEQVIEALAEIEKELQSVIEEDKKSWIRVYELMAAVESKKLYRKDYTSYTQWVNKIAADMHVHVSLLWRRKKAGAFYSEYQERMRKKGKQVYFGDIEGVSPDNLVIAEKIAGSNTKVADQLIEKIQHGELKRKDLSNALAAVRRSRAEKGISAPKNG